jgi:hypothetical protein
MSNLTWLRVAVRNHKIGIAMMEIWLWVEYQKCRKLSTLSNGYSHNPIQLTVWELRLLETDSAAETCSGLNSSWRKNFKFEAQAELKLREFWTLTRWVTLSFSMVHSTTSNSQWFKSYDFWRMTGCWNAVLDRLDILRQIGLLTKICHDNLGKFEYQNRC